MIAESRAALRTALETGGLVTAAIGERFTPPVVVIEPDAEWITASALSAWAREVRWRLLVLTGKPDQPAAAAELDALAESIDAAILAGPSSLGLVGFDPPGSIDLAGIVYAGFMAHALHRTAGGP